MNEFKYVIYINARPSRVWAALKKGEPVVSAMAGTEFRTTFDAGTTYAYIGKSAEGNEVSYIWGAIIDAQPNNRIEMTYRSLGSENESRVVYTFEEVAGKYTKLTVTHDRFEPGDSNLQSSQVGWPQLLSNLKSVIETGEVMRYHIV